MSTASLKHGVGTVCWAVSSWSTTRHVAVGCSKAVAKAQPSRLFAPAKAIVSVFCSTFVDQLGSDENWQVHHAKIKFRACKGCPVTLKFSCLYGPFALLRGCRYVVLMRSFMRRCRFLPKMTLFLPCERNELKTRPFSNWFFQRANRLASMNIQLNIANMDIPWYLSYPKFQVVFGSLKSYTCKDQHVIFQASHVQDDHGITMSPAQTTMIYASWIFCKPNVPSGGENRPICWCNFRARELENATLEKEKHLQSSHHQFLFFQPCVFSRFYIGWRWLLPALHENCDQEDYPS